MFAGRRRWRRGQSIGHSLPYARAFVITDRPQVLRLFERNQVGAPLMSGTQGPGINVDGLIQINLHGERSKLECSASQSSQENVFRQEVRLR